MASDIPSTMKAWRYHKQGDPLEVLHLEDVPVPNCGDDQVLVKVKCAAVSPAGYNTMKYISKFMVTPPAIPEVDISGIVVAVGKDVTKFKVGDPVYGQVNISQAFKRHIGALAEYVPLFWHHTARKSDNVTWQEAAGIPVSALTGYQALVTHANAQPGQKIFLNGAAGGIGHFVIQMAKALGVKDIVVGTSRKNAAFVKSLGATEVLDYTESDIVEQLKTKYSTQPFDAFIDMVGNTAMFNNSPLYLKPEGKYVNVGSKIEGLLSMIKFGLTTVVNIYLPRILGGVNRSYVAMMNYPSEELVEAVNKLVIEGKLKTTIDSEFAFSDVLAAEAKMMTNRTVGKIIINVS